MGFSNFIVTYSHATHLIRECMNTSFTTVVNAIAELARPQATRTSSAYIMLRSIPCHCVARVSSVSV